MNRIMILPFVLLLLSIAILPFVNKRRWEKSYPLVAFGFSAITIAYYVFVLQNPVRMLQMGIEYGSFIILIGSLFVVAGGIHIRMRGKTTPVSNVFFLALGAIFSNFLGTVGASMMMIRPYLHVNRYRLRAFHVVFFIYVVGNIGGALTPLGDPPLFLGYLKGIPFFWMLENVWKVWLVGLGLILVIFFVIDSLSFRKFEAGKDRVPVEELHEETEIVGIQNLFFLMMILLALFVEHPPFLRELMMVVAAAGSYVTTKKEIRKKNDFNFLPMKEVGFLFFGIFVTMVPALDWLELNAASVGITTPGQFYWGTGILSSVLDNAPTYLNFLSLSFGLFVDRETIAGVQHLISTHGAGIASVAGAHADEIRAAYAVIMKHHADVVASGTVPIDYIQTALIIGSQSMYLKAISVASVFFGAATYIGNAPNFMVKSIAEQAGVKCPGFGGYILKYSLPVLIPVFWVVWWIMGG